MSTTQQPQFTLSVQLTDVAAEQVRGFFEQQEIDREVGGLRISVLPGGCSGFKYSLNVEDAPEADDIVVDREGVRLFVDHFSAPYLEGVTIGYQSSMMGTGFTFENPNATGGCGCGSSFSA